MSSFFSTNQPLIEATLINIGFAFSQYVVLRAGVFSVATIGLAGIGGYTAGLCAMKLSLPYLPSLLAAVLLTTACSLLLARPLVRLRGIFQAVATLAFVLVLQAIFNDASGLTGGSLGLIGIPHFVSEWHLLVAVIVMMLLLMNLGRTRVGRAFDAMASDETAAVSHGVDVRRYQFLAFGISGAFAGLSGGLLAFQNYGLDPTLFGFNQTIDILVYVVLGGALSVAGPVVGTIIFMALPQIAGPLASNRDIIVGAVLIAIVVYLPNGLVDSSRLALRDWRTRRRRTSGTDPSPVRAVAPPGCNRESTGTRDGRAEGIDHVEA